jgi:ATP-dependent RNA helicase RhlE
LNAAAIHGNKSQAARTRALAGFKAGSVSVLVATDIAARGLDIDQLPQVVNFELPNVAEDYVHRIGRTGRAGATGAAISLVDNSEIKLLKAIEKLIRKPIDRVQIQGWMPSASTVREHENDERESRSPRGGGRGFSPVRSSHHAGGRNGGIHSGPKGASNGASLRTTTSSSDRSTSQRHSGGQSSAQGGRPGEGDANGQGAHGAHRARSLTRRPPAGQGNGARRSTLLSK